VTQYLIDCIFKMAIKDRRMRITLVCITLLFSPWIFANEFDWAYKGFLYSFEARQFEDLEPFFAENTLLGFGPSEVGYSAFLQK